LRGLYHDLHVAGFVVQPFWHLYRGVFHSTKSRQAELAGATIAAPAAENGVNNS